MKLDSLQYHRILRIGALGLVTLGWLSLLLALAYLPVRAAPPAQGPITIAEINHMCAAPGLAESPLNDTYDAATTLTPGQVKRHTLDSGGESGTPDKDWFSFTTINSQVFTLTATIPTTSVLTMTEISLFTSATAALSGDNPVMTSTSGELAWVADSVPATQTFWTRLRNPHSADQDESNDFCDYVYDLKVRFQGNVDWSETTKTGALSEDSSTITYTIVLSNLGELVEPVIVTDQIPVGLNLEQVTVNPSVATSSLVTTTTNLTWTGQVSDYSSVVLTVRTQVDSGAKDTINTTWITAGSSFTRASSQIDINNNAVYLPIILKSLVP